MLVPKVGLPNVDELPTYDGFYSYKCYLSGLGCRHEDDHRKDGDGETKKATVHHVYDGKSVNDFRVQELSDGHTSWIFKFIERNRKLDSSSIDEVPVCQMGGLLATI